MTKKTAPDPADLALFRQEVGTLHRLQCDRVELAPPPPPPIPRSRYADEHQVLEDMLSDYFEPADMDTGEELIYRSNGVQQSVIRKLRRGQFPIGAALDLHGMTVDIARVALGDFLYEVRRNQMTCVRIIHGKGNRSRHKGPVLKQKVNHWLRQREEVLAFCSARPDDGGTGAIYLLLKRL